MLLCSSVPRGVAALAFLHRRYSTGLPAYGVSASTLSCFPMVQHCLLCRVSRGAATLPHRLPLEMPTRQLSSAHQIVSSHLIAAAQTDANLSAHLHRLPTPPPYLRQMRLLPGRVRRSCKSPRARILVLGTSGAHWPARWPRFELTERVDKS